MDDSPDSPADERSRHAPITKWHLEEAQRRLEEVMDRVYDEGPQIITRHGKDFVLMTRLEYWRLTGEKPNFIEFLLNIPICEELDLTRDRSPMRDIER